MEELIQEFLTQKRIAVVGATDRTHKFGYKIFKDLTRRGYEVYPVNPRLTEIDGIKCYPRVAEVPAKVDLVNLVVPPVVSERVIQECIDLGITRVWLQPGAESDRAVELCKQHKIKVVYNTCIMLST